MHISNRLALILSFLLTFSSSYITAENIVFETEPSVIIEDNTKKIIQEYRINGFLYAIKVTPSHGEPYCLVPAYDSNASYIHADQPKMLVPEWEIFSW